MADRLSHSGPCFLKDKQTLRIYGADGGAGVYHRDVTRFADFYSPCSVGYWNAITVQWCFKSGKFDSGVWVNWKEVLTFRTTATYHASGFCLGDRLIWHTPSSGFKGLIAYLAIYPSATRQPDSVCQALTTALCEKFGVRRLTT